MRECLHPTCNTGPIFNFPQYVGQGRYCKEHAKPGMIDVKNKKCGIDGCKIRPHFNYPGEKKGERCLVHSLPGMVNVVSARCKECDSLASFNFPGTKERLYCSKHAKPEMICITVKKCEHKFCERRARYGFNRRKFCNSHKEEGMRRIQTMGEIEKQEKTAQKKDGGPKTVSRTSTESLDGGAGRATAGGGVRHRRSKLVNWEVVERLLQGTS